MSQKGKKRGGPGSPRKPDGPENLKAPALPDDPSKISGSSRNRILILLTIVAALGGATAAAVRMATSQSEPVKALAERPKTIFDPVARREGIDRKTLPSELETALKDLATLEPLSGEYDPAKPNFYIIPQRHLAGGGESNQERRKEILDLQARILRIQHALFSFGLRTQFLEGVDPNIELRHDVVRRELGEDPVRAMPKYKKTGEVGRAYVAFEGIYGDEVDSFGAEDGLDDLTRLLDRYAQLERVAFPQAMEEIMKGVAAEFGVEIPRDAQTGRVDVDVWREKIWERVSKLSPEDRQKLIEKHVLANRNYKEFLDVAAKKHYDRLQGRNHRYVKVIKGKGEVGDASFVVGAEHVKHLVSILGSDHNFFLLVPKDLDRSTMQPSYSEFSEDDYRQTIFAEDLYAFGLGEKPSGK